MLKITIGHWDLEKIAKNSREDFEWLKSHQPDLSSYDDIIANKGWCTFEQFCNNIDELPEFVLKNIKIEPVKPLKVLVDGRISNTSVSEVFRAHQVHLPGNELLKIREVKVCEDYCTEELQNALKDGWKIIAVCPQPASRRPDYILGREFG